MVREWDQVKSSRMGMGSKVNGDGLGMETKW